MIHSHHLFTALSLSHRRAALSRLSCTRQAFTSLLVHVEQDSWLFNSLWLPALFAPGVSGLQKRTALSESLPGPGLALQEAEQLSEEQDLAETSATNQRSWTKHSFCSSQNAWTHEGKLEENMHQQKLLLSPDKSQKLSFKDVRFSGIYLHMKRLKLLLICLRWGRKWNMHYGQIIKVLQVKCRLS